MLDAFLLLGGAELLVVSRTLWPVRRPLAAVMAVTLSLVSGSMLGNRFSWAMVLLAVISMYRVINLLRVVQSRSNEHFLRTSVRKTTVWLFVSQVIILWGLSLSDYLHLDSSTWWLALSCLQLAAAVGVLLTTERQRRAIEAPDVSEHFSDSHLPSLSVCIPARNETQALEDCLHSLVASDYPKLEIIVLDDCSQASRTTDIIRSFAHDGVRFIQGKPVPEEWLAKNWAYQQLFEATSGSHVLFCGVDVRFEPNTIRNLVTTLLANNKRLVSVMPRNSPPAGPANQLALLIQPVRYAWELCLPRRSSSRPPVLSSCWLAERKLIERSGSFAAVTHSILPEAYFARRATLRGGYSFVRSGAGLEVLSLKSRAEQWETAVRTRYPQLRRRIELIFYVTLFELGFVVAPVGLVLTALVQGRWLQGIIAGLTTALIAITYAQVVAMTYRRFLLSGLLLAPFAALLDIYIRHESLWRYEFGEITWKGRNICLPIMHVIPRLPKL